MPVGPNAMEIEALRRRMLAAQAAQGPGSRMPQAVAARPAAAQAARPGLAELGPAAAPAMMATAAPGPAGPSTAAVMQNKMQRRRMMEVAARARNTRAY